MYSVDEQKHFRVVPSDDKVQIAYKDANLVDMPVNFPVLHADGVNVFDKLESNKTDIDDEQSRSIAKENQIEADLATESSRAEAKEDEIKAELDSEKTRLAAQEGLEADALANEVLARETQGINLQTAIDNESNTRASADTAHTQAIINETDRSVAEEQRIEGLVNTYVFNNDQRVLDAEIKQADYESFNDVKVQDNTDAHDALALKQQADHDAEVADRTSAVANVQSQITAMLDGSPEHLDQLAEIVQNLMSQNGSDYETRLTNIETLLADLVEQLQN